MEDFLESNGEFTDKSELMRQALREFFDKSSPRRLDLAINKINEFMEKGPKMFLDKEDGHER